MAAYADFAAGAARFVDADAGAPVHAVPAGPARGAATSSCASSDVQPDELVVPIAAVLADLLYDDEARAARPCASWRPTTRGSPTTGATAALAPDLPPTAATRCSPGG